MIPDGELVIGGDAFENDWFISMKIVKDYAFTKAKWNILADNKIKRVTIGADVSIREKDSLFWYGFDKFYLANGRIAGTYTYNNDRWIWNPDVWQ